MLQRGSPREKALAVNLDPKRYGTFAEIGAGQEVVRWFFQAGGAAGTISKSISAYDMQVSDAIYGQCQRYVCRERLEAMLACEQKLNRQRLDSQRGRETGFFTFADTVSARNYHGTNECHGWMGILFQAEPGAADSRIIIHVRMLDNENALQQEALGVVGVNLVHGAFFLHDQPEALLDALLDNLSTNRIEVDMIEFSGDAFANVDNRIMSLRLVQLGLTGAAMFAADGTVLQPSQALRKKPLLIERGRFRPVTHVNIDLLNSARRRFETDHDLATGDAMPIMEITMSNLSADGDVCLEDFISRADVLQATGHTVMISDYFEFYRLAAYLYRYTHEPIGLAMGLGTLESLFDEHYYENLDGGILECFGRLFKNQLGLYIYPLKDQTSGVVRTIDDVDLGPALMHLYAYLRSRDCIVQLEDIAEEYLDIFSPDVLAVIKSGSQEWTHLVPDTVADVIRSRGLFGYSDGTGDVQSVTAPRPVSAEF